MRGPAWTAAAKVAVAGILFACVFAPAATAADPPQPPAASAPSPSDAPLDLPARIAAYRPYDGAGRYAMDKDDGVRGVQGLATLARRYGVKPYDALAQASADGPAAGGPGRWQEERVIFRDVDTGATVARLTNDPWTDQLSYFQGNWSADGRTIVWRRRPGMWEGSTATHGPMAMNADGTGMRNVFRDYPMVRGEVCSPTDPNLCFAVAKTDTEVVAFDLATGKTHHVVRTVPRGWHMKVSPDGRYLMNRSDISKGGKGLWISSVDGKEFHEIAIPEAIHDSYRFHPCQPKVMFWYEGKFREEGFVQCGFDGAEMTKVNVQFDWNHGDVGIDRGVHCEGYITRVRGNTWGPQEPLLAPPGEEYYDDPADYNGYSTWLPKDQPWAYHTRIVHRPWISEVQTWPGEPAGGTGILPVGPTGVPPVSASGTTAGTAVRPTGETPVPPVNRFRVCYTALQRGSALDCPNASPDGTKVLFNSNMLGAVSIYCAVARLPERPVEVKAEYRGGTNGVLVSWKPPAHHAETAGYRVYRSQTSGVDFQPISDVIRGTTFADRSADSGKDAFYTVAAVEHSGLESPLSDEAYLPASARRAATAATKRHFYLEAEDARLSPEMWLGFRGDASNLHYVWLRKKDATGKATLTIKGLPLAGPCTVWARIKGASEFTIAAGQSSVAVGAAPSASAAWTWVKAAGKLDLKGAEQIDLTSKTYGSAIDCLVLTDDDSFAPASAERIRRPPVPPVTALRAEPASPYTIRLSWAAAEAVHHYNVYCGTRPDFVPSQATLVASPAKPALLDWALKPGTTYHYRVACVDAAGSEGPAGTPATVTTPGIKVVTLEKDFAPAIDFDAPAKDTYVVWLLVKEGKSGGQYVNVNVDGKGGGAWVASLDKLSPQAWLTYDRWGRFDVDAGKHTLRIENKSGNTIEKVLITNDQSLAPPGHINILTGW